MCKNFYSRESFNIFLSTVYPGIQFTNIATLSNGETRKKHGFPRPKHYSDRHFSAIGNLF